MYITNITEAKAHFSALIEKVLAGEEIIKEYKVPTITA